MNVYFGVAWIVMGCVILWRACVGEKAGAVMTLTRPEEGLMSKRERRSAFLQATANLFFGILCLWSGLRHR